MEETLLNATFYGKVEDVKNLLQKHPNLEINYRDYYGRTALYHASRNGLPAIVKILLAHPKVDVNAQDFDERHPFSRAFSEGRVEAVRLLLKVPKVDVNLVDKNECSPLWWASYHGHLEVIKRLIASGRDLGDIVNKKGRHWETGVKYSAIEIAAMSGSDRNEVVSLLERFVADPVQTRLEVRLKEQDWLDGKAVEVFALTVFLCDDLLQFNSALISSDPNAAAVFRFFATAKRLPMELQMLLCHRAVTSTNQNIRSARSEAAFKSLARILQQST